MSTTFVTPIDCRRCRGTGSVPSRVVHAGFPGCCFKCDGRGIVEGDPAAIAAARRRDDATRTIITDSIAAAKAAGMPHHTATRLSYGISHLATNEPDRYEKALNSHLNRHPRLVPALVAYTAEAGFLHHGARNLTAEEALALIGA